MCAFRYAPGSDDPMAGLWEVPGMIEMRTDKAILFFDGTVRAWLPKSRVKIGEKRRDGTTLVGMPDWLAKKAGFA